MNAVLERFLDALGLDEEPLGMAYTNDQPEAGLRPPYQAPITREAEEQGTVDWAKVVQTPAFGPARSSIVAGPMKYLRQG